MSTEFNYLVGESARISVAIADSAGIAVDPGTLRLKVKTPAAVVSTLTVGAGIVKDAVGAYHADVALPAVGTWYYRWEADAPNPGAVEGAINVGKSRVI